MLEESHWDSLPQEIQGLILRGKHTLEAENYKPLFREVLLELLEYTFTCRNKYPGGGGGIYHRPTKIKCRTCKKPIIEIFKKEEECLYDPFVYHSLQGEYDCCYYLQEIIAMFQGKLEVPKTLPVRPFSYGIIQGFRQLIGTLLQLGVREEEIPSLKVFLMSLEKVKCKYKQLTSSLDY